MRRLSTILLLLVAASGWALDWGGSVENTFGDEGDRDRSLRLNSVVRLWTSTSIGEDSLQLRANLSNNFKRDQWGEYAVVNTFRGDVDILQWENERFRLGRSDFRDFTGNVLNTKLDGIQLIIPIGSMELKTYAGISSFIFKGASTIAISEDDAKDRETYEDWTNFKTMWASPRLVAGMEWTAKEWLKDQTFQLGLLGQYDLRPHQGADGERAYTKREHGAPVSTGYGGAGWMGRIAGPLYGSVSAYGMLGRTLTPIGPVLTEIEDGHGEVRTYQIWRSTMMWGWLGSADLSLLQPSLQYLLVNAGVTVGSGDPDGATPQDNAQDKDKKDATAYTGWTGISLAGNALIFNPQPANVLSGHLVVSIRPAPAVQLASTTLISARTGEVPISEETQQNAEGLYLGTESDLMLLWRPVSDVGLALSGGVFFPNTALLASELVQTKLQATLSLNF